MSGLIPLLIQLASGAAGGNLAGSLMKNLSLGTLWNSVAGIAGGGLGGTILSMLGMGMAPEAAGGAMDMANIASSLAGGGVGGGSLMAIIGLVKNAMNK